MRPAVPDPFVRLIDELAPRLLGPDDRTGKALAGQVHRLSEVYTRERSSIGTLANDAGVLAARLRFFLLRDMVKVLMPLAELAAADALPRSRTWRVLDAGAGLGAMTFGAALFGAGRAGVDGLSVHAVDRGGRGLTMMASIAKRAAAAGLVPIDLHTETAELGANSLPPGPFDVVLLGMVLNEMAAERDPDARLGEHARLIEQLMARLAPGGALVIVEPALRTTARELSAVRDRLCIRAGPPFVFAPCVHRRPCPMLASPRDWCHQDLPVALPSSLVPAARGAGLRFERLTYAYLTLRNDAGNADAQLPSEPGRAYRVVSEPLRSKGKLELFGCGEDGRPRLVQLSRHRTESNRTFGKARRGDLLRVDAEPAEAERVRILSGTHVWRTRPGEGPGA